MKRGEFYLVRKPGSRDPRKQRVVMPANLEDHSWYQRDDSRRVQRIAQPQHKIVAREVDGERLAALGSCLECDRSGVQVSDQLIEDSLQVRVGRIAVGVGSAPMKEDIKGPSGCLWQASESIYLRRED